MFDEGIFPFEIEDTQPSVYEIGDRCSIRLHRFQRILGAFSDVSGEVPVGSYLVAKRVKGDDYQVHVFDDKTRAIEFREELPEDERFPLYHHVKPRTLVDGPHRKVA